MKPLALFVLILGSLPVSAQDHGTSALLAPASALPSLAAMKSCLQQAGSAECLDQLFREALKRHSTAEVLGLIRQLEAEDPELRRDCHPVVHAVGRETFRVQGNIHDSFSTCDQTCHSGCYHGSVERFLRGDNLYSQTDLHPSQAEIKQKAVVACDPNTPLRLRFQCLHGLGHALMFFSRYQLDSALSACDALSDEWSRSSCYGGVFMENAFNASNEKKNFSPTDYHYPCNQLAPKYRNECYIMQTSRMVEMGLSTEKLIEECAKAGPYQVPCSQSIGRDLSNDARLGEIGTVAQKCELAAGENRLACMRGVVYALIDNTWDGRHAMPFCAAFLGDADREKCITESIQYLRATFEKSREELTRDCSLYAASSPRCVEIAAR